MSKLTHLTETGEANMVDITEKAVSQREARAFALVNMSEDAFEELKTGNAKKGDVLCVARIAGIQSAKKTHEIIPLCHPLPLSKISIAFELNDQKHNVAIEAIAKTTGQTGVEMEALTAASVAALTIIDMLKAVDKAMVIDEIKILEKKGGKSGHFVAPR